MIIVWTSLDNWKRLPASYKVGTTNLVWQFVDAAEMLQLAASVWWCQTVLRRSSIALL